jgi:hypothetical protein
MSTAQRISYQYKIQASFPGHWPQVSIRLMNVEAGSRSGKDTAFLEDPMEEGAGHPAPFVCLAPAIDDQIDRDIEPSELSAESPVLLPATSEVGLDDQQVQITVGPGIVPRA